jgi:hypothetical protein
MPREIKPHRGVVYRLSDEERAAVRTGMEAARAVSLRQTRKSTNFVGATVLFRHCEERSDEAIHLTEQRKNGLLRFARNDGSSLSRANQRHRLVARE